jgi:uncharacterized repeat protein (TIGR03803 family)
MGTCTGTPKGAGFSDSDGTVFEITLSGTLTTIHDFCPPSYGADGANPWTALLQATDGSLYGTTFYGGAYGYGTVFEVTPSGTVSALYSFCPPNDCRDGYGPSGVLVEATDGNFYAQRSLAARTATAACLKLPLVGP